MPLDAGGRFRLDLPLVSSAGQTKPVNYMLLVNLTYGTNFNYVLGHLNI